MKSYVFLTLCLCIRVYTLYLKFRWGKMGITSAYVLIINFLQRKETKKQTRERKTILCQMCLPWITKQIKSFYWVDPKECGCLLIIYKQLLFWTGHSTLKGVLPDISSWLNSSGKHFIR
ncbi:hypothetical protein BDB01DRAFT_324398 [Pilobolus umbonatus]|nr:hypothetical protein BDB01DRAFT_324398 [Pilobolus umbonatus]